MKKQHPIKNLIKGGESMHLDFKFEISDAPKIARSLVAFANTKGGKLLIGVKDNGSIAGIRSEEEFFMVDSAAKLYCKPEVMFTSKEWNLDGKKILEIEIAPSDKGPHKAPDSKGNYRAFIRNNDQNLLANGTMMKIWKKQKSMENIEITYGEAEHLLMQHLDKNEISDFGQIKSVCNLSKFETEDLLADFILMELVDMQITEDNSFFKLKNHKEI
ncbi:MAG: ATP-binding protein [Marinilabiliales bacterium]|nr:MAG: ATP-binding protein [Marinilabiliales bacterium]